MIFGRFDGIKWCYKTHTINLSQVNISTLLVAGISLYSRIHITLLNTLSGNNSLPIDWHIDTEKTSRASTVYKRDPFPNK